MIKKIALTGGPASGKSTTLARLQEVLPTFGWTTVVLPELATHVFSCGISHHAMAADPARYDAFQTQLLLAILETEDRWLRFLELLPGERKVLICDRGAMDIGVYHHDFTGLLLRQALSPEAMIMRYDGVVHLTSVAVDAPEVYEQVRLSNPHRRETWEEAVAADDRCAAVWAGHPRYVRVGNRLPGAGGEVMTFEAKQLLAQLTVQDLLRDPAVDGTMNATFAGSDA